MKKPWETLADDLRAAKTPRDYSNAYRRLYKVADSHAVEYMEEAGVRVACGDCSFCCYQFVRVLAHEVFAIADYIQTTMTPELRAKVVERLRSYYAETSHLTEEEKDRSETPRACPLLVDGRCSVYPVRPSNCRHFHSLDSSFCEGCIKDPNGWPHTPMHEGLKHVWSDMIHAADYAYFVTGHDQTTYDLAPSCLAALANPAFRRRWTEKKKALLTYDS